MGLDPVMSKDTRFQISSGPNLNCNGCYNVNKLDYLEI